MNHGQALGRLQFYRAKGAVWLDLVRPWLLPVMGGAGLGKYLGLETWQAVLAGVAIPLVAEILAVVLGALEQRSGAIEAHYRAAYEVDPARRLPVEALVRIEALLRAILDELRQSQRPRSRKA